jgi:hypothetical protein
LLPSYHNRTDNPLQLDVTRTKFVGDSLRIVYRESLKYYDTFPFFSSASAASCMDHISWSSEDEYATCSRVWTGVISWSRVYNRSAGVDDAGVSSNDCRVVRTVDVGGNVVFTVPFTVRNKESLSPIRGTGLVRRLQHKMPFQIVFPTQVEVTSSAVDVFAPVLTLGAVVRQEIVTAEIPGATPSARVEVFSSLQWPFRFAASSTTWTALPAGVVASASVPALETRAGYDCAVNSPGAECAQLWSSTLQVLGGACRLNGAYEMAFAIECREPRNLDCPIDATGNTARFRFSLESSRFCAEVVDEIGLSASMTPYLESAHTTVKDDFLDEQVVHFLVFVSSDKASIAKSSLYELTLSIVNGATLDLMNAGVATAVGTSMELAAVSGGSAVVGGVSIASFSFRVKTGAAFLNVAQDGIVEMRAAASMFVQYANGGQTSTLAHTELVRTLSAVGSARAAAEAVLAVKGGKRQVVPDAEESNSSGASVGGVSTAAFAGVVVAISALIVVAAMVGVRAMRRKSAALADVASASRVALVMSGTGEADAPEGAAESAEGATATTTAGMTMAEIQCAYDDEHEGAVDADETRER